MNSGADFTRLRNEYKNRDHRLAESDLYALHNPANLFMFQQRQRDIVSLLNQFEIFPLGQQRILEVGCGKGQIMHEFLGYGAAPECLYGIDILEHHVRKAAHTLPHLPLACADGRYLPYKNDSFDLIMQYTAFSSILDQSVKSSMAQEMLRVLAPTGLILWYDFWINPTNPQTRGIRPIEVRDLFPECQYTFRRITLAPPISRRLSTVSWLLCCLLERFVILNTHYLVAIRKSIPD